MLTTACRPDWDDPQVTGRNRVLTHVPLGAYADADSARRGDRLASPYVRSLNGRWRFQLTPSPAAMPAGFADPAADDSDWLQLAVPSNWQLDPAVPDRPIYTNIPYPFRKNPPAPPEVNPTGWYRRSFELPADWAGREVFLLFESCDSACKLWVNGLEAGYSEDSKLPHEFDITALLRPGRNHLAVMVPRYCSGFWLECQDYWHLSGIQRDVLLYSKPPAHLRDFSVRTVLDAQCRDAELQVRAYMNEVPDLAGHQVELTLYDPAGKAVWAAPVLQPVATASPMYGDTAPEFTAASFRVPVAAPRLWTAETPWLYTLVLTLRNAAGQALDFESCRVGFREVRIREGQLQLNGRRLVLRGVDCHEHHPAKGRALSVADMRDEIVAMKRLNFNAIRTSHYPHHPAFYDLCDELGMYVLDEANLETHGVGAMLSKDPLWLGAYLERAQRMALRDKNHPCVIGWSLGNESHHGPHHAAMANWLRYYDPTRPVQYESGFPGPAISDIMCPMYPKFEWITQILADPRERRPLIMCEYAYSKGNALGNFRKYWDLVDQWPRFQGGFIWDWRDKALLRPVNGKPEWAYGNEFDGGVGPDGFAYGKFENPQMCLNGVVNPDLTPKPGAFEVKKVQAPVAFLPGERLLAGELTVWNKYLALDLAHLEFGWELTCNGEVQQEGVVAAPAARPGEKALLRLPVQIPATGQPAAEYWLNIAAWQVAATPWSEPGHVIAWEQFRLPVSVPGVDPAPHPELHLEGCAEPERLVVTGTGFELAFDRSRGALASYRLAGRELLAAPLEHSFMRARTDNDYMVNNPGSYYQDWLAAGLDRLETRVLACDGGIVAPGLAVVRCVTRHQAAGQPRGFLCQSSYTIFATGDVLVENRVDAEAGLPLLPRIGMKLALVPGFERLSWYGRGPFENYPDRKEAALVGCYRASVDEQFFPYVDPCECGAHQDTRWLRLEDDRGVAFTVRGEPLLQFSALHYRIADLLAAGHVYELTRTPETQLNLDGFHFGVGGDTGWTRNVHPEYQLPAGTYRYAFRLGAGPQ